jgi:hypothetical protein
MIPVQCVGKEKAQTMQNASELLDREFLDTRCMLVEIAATLDRIDRAARRDGQRLQDARLNQIYQSLALLAEPSADDNRSEQLLMLFTDE